MSKVFVTRSRALPLISGCVWSLNPQAEVGGHVLASTVVVLVVCNHYNSTSVHIDPLQNKLAGQSPLGAVN